MKLIPELHVIAKAKNYRIKRAKALFLMTALLFSLVSGNISQINPMQKLYAQVSSVSPSYCQKLPIASVTATGNDRNVRINVLDNNIYNKWSNLGVGSFIQADLGAPKTICSVDITWYRGNLRQNNFVISVSNDGNSFTNVFTGKSSGTTLSAEKYNLPTSVTARFVRLTVNGNTENNWASITKLSVDGSGNSNTIQTNVGPYVGNSNTIHTYAGTYVRITLTGTDPIPGDVLKFSVVGLPQHGTLTNPTSNSVAYTPNPGFSGTDSFTYKTTDSQGVSSNIATASITVNPPPHPTAYSKTIQTNAGTSVQVTTTGTDPIPGDVLKFSVVGLPQHGTLTNPTSNSVTYVPNNGFSGTDSFTYKATDGQGVSSNIATASITVNPPPPPPTADNKTIQTNAFTPITVNSSQNNSPTAYSKTIQTNARTPVQVTTTGTNPIPGQLLKFSVVGLPQHGTLTNPTSNSVTYVPNNGFSGTDSFTYKATDGQGVFSNIAKVSITVNAPSPPTAYTKTIPTNSGTSPSVNAAPSPPINQVIHSDNGAPIAITLTGTDPIPGDVLKFSVVGLPKHGTLTDGTVSSSKFYTPNSGFSGTDSFTYKATDGQGIDSKPATVMILVSNGSSGTLNQGGVNNLNPNINTNSVNLDQFGVEEIYPSAPGGEQWFFNPNDPNNDPRTGTSNEGPHTTFTQENPDGSWKVQASMVRYGVLTSTLFQENQISTLDQQQMANQGYMLRPNDWKNVELTAYLRVNHATSSTNNGEAHIEFGAHGARNTNGGTVGGFDSSCEATAYHSNTYLTGRVKFEKDLKHTAGYSVGSADPQELNAINTTEFNGQNWIGIKAVIYDIGNGSVKVEQWVDDYSNNIQPGNHWRKVLETIDNGQWGPTRGRIGSACGGGEFQVASWGGPIALFRWDNIDDMDIKDASVREITPA
ncbi:MAG: Ig-like domain-containing protein [Candidatus Nitrosopolaris sp.]